MAELDLARLVLARVVDEHRIRPSAHTCRCGWEAEPGGPPMSSQYVGHVTSEQAKALDEAGLLATHVDDGRPGAGVRGATYDLLVVDEAQCLGEPPYNHETTGGH